EGKKILNGVSLTIKKGEIHAIMGPNGGGKSTLAQVMMGHPGYVITEGSIHINSIDITKMSTDQRAKHGLFLGFQYPVEVSGVNFSSFLRMAVNERPPASDESTARQGKKISPIKFRNMLQEKAKPLAFRDDISKRSLNEGFSGGEKKKAEILQMALLKPDFAVLDEPDSGLDVDALKYIANTINSLDFPFGLLLITHYQRILHYIKPQFVHILVKGKIIKSGDHLLAKEIEEKGYEEYIYE
ncbi:MAG TPA: Fe-S cluster assembly ATPase SufC, partial [Candidatus Saccharimonadales bacterium]|nr:Fe-S cluster assembly ATPase SufC [Candidatus Saccharimonadales bacterium]